MFTVAISIERHCPEGNRMLFSSLIFIFYFLPITFAGYYFLCFSRPAQNYFLFFASIFFYAWGEPVYALLMLASIAVNYGFGLLVARQGRHRQTYLIVGIVLNILVLIFYKYAAFLMIDLFPKIQAFDALRNVAIPLGISFYTFQSISYLVDVYRNPVIAQRNPLYLGMYIAFFPQLIAGPIVRYTEIKDQILGRRSNWKKISFGLCIFITGLAKKIFIANNMGAVTDHIFLMASQKGIASSLALLGSVSYSFQIYFDFSAYSDMAIGLGLLFGFKLPDNFRYPYISSSISEFWRRWHITLGKWFKDYVYVPLGGSWKGMDRTLFNLFVVWFLTGLWHGGAAEGTFFTFFIWGMLNFICVAGEKVLGKLNKMPRMPAGQDNRKTFIFWRHLYVLSIITIGFTLFRAPNLKEAGNYFSCLFGEHGIWEDHTWMFLKEYAVFYLMAILFCQPLTERFKEILVKERYGIFGKMILPLYSVLIVVAFSLSIVWLVKGAYNPFIYFRF
jgi:alginate O-acetyltransferase complex protein AlgI